MTRDQGRGGPPPDAHRGAEKRVSRAQKKKRRGQRKKEPGVVEGRVEEQPEPTQAPDGKPNTGE